MTLRRLPLLLLLSPLAAQEPQPVKITAPLEAPAQVRERVVVDVYDAERSRELFEACDSDGDCRLDLFEAAAALDTIGSPREIERFRRLDKDRDGYLSFDEFDFHYREVIRVHESLRLRPCRAVAAAARPAAALSVERQLLQLFDKDRSGDFSKEELAALCTAAGLPPEAMATVERAAARGKDRFTVAEIAPLLQGRKIPGVVAAAAKPLSPMPAPFTAWDTNGDGVIDEAELTAALCRYDPQLARWAHAILRAADASHDGKLTAEELRAAAPPASQAAAEPPKPR